MKKIFTIIALTVLFSMNAQTFWFQGTDSNAIQTANATASGTYSTAMGSLTTASGDASTAMGLVTEASGDYSTAMGLVTEASGGASTAMGYETTASDYGSLVIGQYNSSGSSATSADSFSTANTAFVIGNGTDGNNISDAFSILFDGTTNIAGSVTATSFVGDGSQLTGITGSASSLNDLTDVLVDSNSSMFLGTPPTNSTGSYNTASGTNSLKDNTSGYRNTASGDSSLSSNTTGYNNTALGASSLGTNTTGNDNTASGYYSLYFNTSGESNTASGSNSLFFNTTGDYNTASGHNSLYANTIGQGNTASGLHSLSLNTTGNFNTASGGFSLNSNTEGNNNTALGYAAGGSSPDAINQTIIGYEATGVADNSVVLGNEDVTAVYMGEDSGATVYAAAFVGDGSGLTGITGSVSSLNDLTDVLVDSNNSMFLGTPPANSTGEYNTALGHKPLYSNTTGDNNTALGDGSLYSNTEGSQNTASGGKSLYSNTTGSHNTASGRSSLYSNTTGDDNTASGSGALITNTTGSQNTALGYNVRGSSADAINQTIIGYEATGIADNSVVLGNDDVTAVYMGEDSGATVYAAGLNIGGTEITSTATELNLLIGATSLGTGILSPVTENSNTGVRLSTAVAANHGDIGDDAVDLSYSNSASTTSGATGDYSTAMGDETTASGSASTAMGTNTTASGTYSTAMGGYTTASAFYSTAMGGFTTASETYSTAMGRTTTASGYASTAMGFETTASGENSTAMGGGTEASGYYSTAMGKYTTASDYGSLVIGQYNSSGSSATSANSFSTANTAFVIGNGADSGLSDAFSILFDGTTNIAGSVTATSFVGDGSGLTGITGTEGKSAYEIAVDNGFTGTIAEWLLSLNGTDGAEGKQGSQGLQGEDGGDDQQLSNFILSADSLLSLSIQDGNVVSVNLAPLLADLEAENKQQESLIDNLTTMVATQQASIEALILRIDNLTLRMETVEECACGGSLGTEDSSIQQDRAYLLQNIPNSFKNTTSIGYFVPYTNAKAHIEISTTAGQIVDDIQLSNLGVGSVSINNSRMASAVYLYTLYVDGKRIDTKRMVLE